MTGQPLAVLAVNAGSTSVKLRVLGPGDRLLASRDLGALPGSGPALDTALAELRDRFAIGAVAHRVVHGGPVRTAPALVDDELLAELGRLHGLAPSHTAPALQALRAARAVLPVPHVACFDTAFHATLPAAAATYAIPLRWRERYGLRRYGFHGLSHAYAARRAATLLGADLAKLRLVYLPSRRRRLARCRAGRALGGHDDGVHTAGRPGDGDPQRQR